MDMVTDNTVLVLRFEAPLSEEKLILGKPGKFFFFSKGAFNKETECTVCAYVGLKHEVCMFFCMVICP